MGYGDEIMVTAQAKRLNEETGKRVLVVDIKGKPRWSDLWLNNPRITQDRYNAVVLKNGGNCRPYIADKTTRNWIWRQFKCEPGELYLSEDEQRFGEAGTGYVVIEPHLKQRGGNKDYGWARWEAVAELLKDLPLAQVGSPGTRTLPGVRLITTSTFRDACAVLWRSAAFVGGEGGLHHAAAALDVPAVVIFGAFISPAVTGYDQHINLFTGDELGCGSRMPCKHCREAMEKITPEEVAKHVRDIL